MPFVNAIRKGKPDLIFYSDSNLGFQLYRWRQQIGVPYKLLFSNGGPCSPPFDRTDFVHQVSPLYRQQALQAGESANKHILVPYGINIPHDDLFLNAQEIQHLRQKLGLPLNRKIVISVGAIDSNSHKRMDYVVNEIAMMPEARPYLLLLGHIPPEGQSIIEQAHRQLGSNNFTARSVSYQEVSQYYQIADVFTLASLSEGFGRVFLEALMHGLPCIIHDHPVMRYVIGSYGTFVDLSIKGNLANGLSKLLSNHSSSHEQKIERRQYVENTFSWTTLAPEYLEMFHHCLDNPMLSINNFKS